MRENILESQRSNMYCHQACSQFELDVDYACRVGELEKYVPPALLQVSSFSFQVSLYTHFNTASRQSASQHPAIPYNSVPTT